MKYIMIGLIVLLLVFAACDSKENENNQQPNNDNNQASVDSNSNAGDDSNDVADGDSGQADMGGSDGESGSNAIVDFFKKKGTLTYMVEYDMKTTGSDQNIDGIMTQYMKGTDKIRMDTAFQGQESRTYIVDDEYFVCTNDGEWTCLKINGDMSASDEMQADVEANAADYEVSNLPSRSIAGVTTSCFKVSVDTGSVEYCFSPEGVPLFIKTDSSEGYSTEMEANTYSTKVANSAFDLPAEPTDMSDLMNNMPDLADLDIPNM